ncbi:ferritin-like domain-containing protein, partial [Francisella tularensis]|uniref:ferritin-like domain-containing protein n=1 Tax=Francisella tularensis TaxID=263 RepID=UPI0023ADB525|nr:bacterioferritin [Francisella tularensis subsp. holarctica]
MIRFLYNGGNNMELKLENKQEIIDQLNKILVLEMSGIVRYTHYSLMIIGHNRIPRVSWMQSQASESLTHAPAAGEMI